MAQGEWRGSPGISTDGWVLAPMATRPPVQASLATVSSGQLDSVFQVASACCASAAEGQSLRTGLLRKSEIFHRYNPQSTEITVSHTMMPRSR